MAFLVEQDPGEVANAHYHQADQFQVVVAGEGTLGTHAVRPWRVHFAGAFTAYGPIRAGRAGLTYFTLRNGFDPGARYMMRRENRQALRTVSRGGIVRRWPDRWTPAGKVLLGPSPTAWRPGISASHRANVSSGPASDTGRGQHWLVVDGSVWRDGCALGRLSCAFVYPDEAPFTVTGGPAGARLLAMQFPRQARG